VGRQRGSIHEHGIAYFPDGRRAATVGSDEFVHIWDLEQEKELATWTGQAGHKGCVTISPDGLLLATGGNERPAELGGYAYVWDVGDGTLERRLRTPRQARMLRVVFQADGLLAATSVDSGEVVLWDPYTGRLLRRSETFANSPSSIAALPGGRLLTADADGIVRLWTPVDP
jgi:WD40 repeat protein